MPEQFYYRRQVIEIFDCDEEFLNELEQEQLIESTPEQTGNEIGYTPDQMERLRVIRSLVKELDVNLAGVEVILGMRENMIRMQKQFDQILESLVNELKVRISH